MAKVLRPSFYSGMNVYKDNLQGIVDYDASQRSYIITRLYHDGAITSTPYDLNALRVMTDSYRNNAQFADFETSFTAGNPLQMAYTTTSPPDPRVLYAQKFRARSNNIQKVRLWMLMNIDPGIVWGTVFVEIRSLVGHVCTSTNSCSCQSIIPDDMSDLYTEPSSDVLARVVLDHNLLNNSFPYIDVNFSTEPRVSNIDGRSAISSGNYYAIVIGRDYSAVDSTLSIHGNFGNNMPDLTSFVTKFDPSSGLWIDQTGDSMAYQIFSDTIEILPGDGYCEGKFLENPFTIMDTSGTNVDYHLGNIDLVHVKSVSSAGSVDAGGDGRNMVIVRVESTPADYQPNPRTGNPSAVAEADVIRVMVVTEKEWRTWSLDEQRTWLLLAYVTDENSKTVKGLYEDPCDINSSVIHGSWSPGLIEIEDARKFIPHAQVMKYGDHDEIPVRAASQQYNGDLLIEQTYSGQMLAPLFEKDPLHGPLNIFRTACSSRTEMSVFDASFGVMLITPHLGKFMYYVNDTGNWDKLNVVPPMVQSITLVADPSSAPRNLNNSITFGACTSANPGLKLRLNWTLPPTGYHTEYSADGVITRVEDKPYRGVVIVRSTEDFPRSIDDGVIIAASEAGFVTTDGRTYTFGAVGQVNECCASSLVPGIIGTTNALVYPMPSFSLDVVNITEGGTYNTEMDFVEFDITPGVTFEAKFRIQNIGSRILYPKIVASLIHGITPAVVGSKQLMDITCPITPMYDTNGEVELPPISIPIPFDYAHDPSDDHLPHFSVDGTEYNMPTGPMAIDVGFYDSRFNEQVGHSIIHVKNNDTLRIHLTDYLLTRIDASGAETPIGGAYLTSTDKKIGLSSIVLTSYYPNQLNKVTLEAYAIANLPSGSGNYVATEAKRLTIETVSVTQPGMGFAVATVPVVKDILAAGDATNGTAYYADYNVRIDVEQFLADAAIGDSNTPSPITIFLVLKHGTDVVLTPPTVHENLCTSALELFSVKRSDVVDGTECTCYIDSYTGLTSSVVFSGCTPQLAANACYNGLSYNQLYYYTVFTYNDAGHFSYTDRCNQAVYGMSSSIPPGAVCQLELIETVGGGLIDNVQLQWTNPIDPQLYGFRIYVSESGHLDQYGHAINCNTSFASDFVMVNGTKAASDEVSGWQSTACNMMMVYDTFLTPWITDQSPHISRVAGDVAYFYDGQDNVDPSSNDRVLYELADDGKSLVSNVGVKRSLTPGVLYNYTIFTYDIYGNFNAPSCIDRGNITLTAP